MTSFRMRLSWLILILSAMFCFGASDPEPAALLQKGVTRGFPGIALMIRDGKGTIRSAAAGYSDLEHHTAMKVDDGFHLASVTKVFTAVATLRFVDQRKLSLDARLADLLGDAVSKIPNADKITVEQLLDHSSGIYPTNNDLDYLSYVIGSKADPKRIYSSEEFLALADPDRNKPRGAPGSGHYYSDTNYILLGMILEKVSGRPFKKIVEENIFQPLKMDSTYFYSDVLLGNSEPKVKTVQGYLLATPELQSIFQIPPLFKPVPGMSRKDGVLLNTTLASERIDSAGGIVSTLPDLMKFAEAVFYGKLLTPASQKFLMAAADGMKREPVGASRTWTMEAVRKEFGVLVFKSGDGPGGVNTLMAYSPDLNTIYLCFTNYFGNSGEVDFMMDEIIGPLSGPDR